MENILQCKGKKFKANIYNIPVEGRIQVEEGSIYLCQNVKDGADCEDKLGFKCSWHIEDGSEMALIKNNVSNLCIHPSTKEEAESFKDWQVGDKLVYESNTWEVIFRSGELVVCKRENGNVPYNFTCDELYTLGFRLVYEPDPETEIVEVTMDEIAKMKGIPVERLHIKKE